MSQTMKIGNLEAGRGKPLLIIAGPCVIETLDQCMHIAKAMSERCEELGLSYIFKASFDKANRSSIHSARGPGMEQGLKIMAEVRDKLGMPITTDIHDAAQ